MNKLIYLTAIAMIWITTSCSDEIAEEILNTDPTEQQEQQGTGEDGLEESEISNEEAMDIITAGRWYLSTVIVDGKANQDIMDDYYPIRYRFFPDGSLDIYIHDEYIKTSTWSISEDMNILTLESLVETVHTYDVIRLEEGKLYVTRKARLNDNQSVEAEFHYNL